MSLASVFVKVALIGVIFKKYKTFSDINTENVLYFLNLIPLPIVLSDSKIDKKGYPFPSCRYKSQLIKRVPFSSFANKCIAR